MKTKQNKNIGENQQTKLKVVEDGRPMNKFVHLTDSNPFFLYLYNTYVIWIHIVTKATYFSNLYLRCANQSEIPLDLRQEQRSSPRKDQSTLQL